MAKSIRWMGSSRSDLRAFPVDARGEAGFQLRMVQAGEAPLDWKPMRAVGPGVMEIRVHRAGEFRVLYVAKFREAIYVLHCFGKKTGKTSQADIDRAKRSYDEVVAVRRTERA
jgi:phage-related protein